jgi:hypothetical protein
VDERPEKPPLFQFGVGSLFVATAALAAAMGVILWLAPGSHEFGAMLWIWFVHATIAAVLSVPVVFFGRRRVHWQWWELSVLVLPFIVWTLLMFSLSTGRKSLANLGEPFLFSFAVPLAALARVCIGTRFPERRFAVALILALCSVAIAVFFGVPSLPE